MTTFFIIISGIFASPSEDQKYLAYLYMWEFFHILFLCYLMPVAILQIGNRSWGTR